MIALLFALQVAVAAPIPTFIVVRDGASTSSVPVTISGGEPSVRADALVRALKGTLITGTNLHYTLALPRARMDLIDGIPFAKVDTLTVPLTRAPQVRGGNLYLPFQFVSEVIPRYAGGYFYDAAQAELRTFTVASGTVRPPAPNSTTVSAATTKPAPVPTAAPSTSSSTPPRVIAASKPRVRKLVVIDAGHGGPDRGMTGPIGNNPPWFVEKDVTLSVAKKLEAVMRARGYDVLMTRTTDTLIALYDRGRIANANHGDVFVSIHCNAPGYNNAAGARERGFETYFLAEAKTEDERRVQDMENESVKFETGANAAKGDPLSFIITDMAQNEHLRESSDLAQTIQDGLIEVHPGPNRGVQQANFAVLRGSYMPAVLIEIGFGSNQSEATYLSDQANQRALARSIGDSIIAYLGHYESRVVGGQR
ncbi:MAG TPA: N-acetylmuramoyl-L-alanine amidase [Gemmatimonadaceae bacterium]|jgi:N-acetylmuramoyl-L-alanine amidase|nr:N-acetylmuramoyl-L-alanine amidase [Gemmatimonadaceae bacterium]